MSDTPKGKCQQIEPWPEPVEGRLLLNELAQVLRQVVILPNCGAEILALWVVHTYAFLLRHVSTYIGIESPEKQCGKTTLLGVLSHLVSRPEIAANISPSAFFRVIEETRPTLLIDEADTFLKRNQELRGILNAGYTDDTAYVVRVASHEDENKSRLVRFSCFCPKAIASIGRLPETLADRCIPIRMQRKTPRETCQRLDLQAAADLRRKCARFILDQKDEITRARPPMPPGLPDCMCDIFEPLTAIADLAGGEWPEMARQAAVSLTLSARENNPIGSLLLDIMVVFVELKAERMFTRRLIAGLNAFTERPWRELTRGREMTDQILGGVLRPYNVSPRTLWIEGASAKGYAKADFAEVFKRYIPRSEIDALLAEDAALKAHPPSSDSGAPGSPSCDSEATSNGDEKKDEPEGTGGEVAAA